VHRFLQCGNRYATMPSSAENNIGPDPMSAVPREFVTGAARRRSTYRVDGELSKDASQASLKRSPPLLVRLKPSRTSRASWAARPRRIGPGRDTGQARLLIAGWSGPSTSLRQLAGRLLQLDQWRTLKQVGDYLAPDSPSTGTLAKPITPEGACPTSQNAHPGWRWNARPRRVRVQRCSSRWLVTPLEDHGELLPGDNVEINS
jgi:hypothetical protein